MTQEENDEAATKEDISLTPMAMPMLSGPGSIGVVMGLAAHVDSMTAYLGMVIGIAALAVTVYLFLRLGGPLVDRLGPSRRWRDQPHLRIPHPGNRSAVGMGRRSRVQVSCDTRFWTQHRVTEPRE